MRLKSLFREGRPFPPGGYPFVDGRTGKKFDGSSADLKLQAENVIKHRQANPHVYNPEERKYLDKDWVMLEIEDFMCKSNPSICGDDLPPRPADPTFATPTQECACGVRDWRAQFCKSCGSGKLQKWVCGGCGNALNV